MEKLIIFVKENKIIMCLCWVVIICVLFIFINNILYSEPAPILQLVLVAVISLFIYWTIVLTVLFTDSSKKLKWLSSISSEFVHLQISMENDELTVEVLEGEYEKISQYAKIRGIETEKISEHNGITKAIIK